MNLKGRRFENSRLGIEIFVYDVDGKEMFIGRDIAELLGYSNPSDAVSKNVAKDFKRRLFVRTIENTGYMRNAYDKNANVMMISESGLYQLIFKSDLKLAIDFQKWVCEEVLPSIRKNNFYISDSITDEQKDKLISDLTAQTKNSENLLLNNKKRKLVLETCLKDMFPNVPDVYEQFLSKMRKSGMLTESNKPTDKFRENNSTYGLFRHHEDTYIETTTKFTLTNNGINHLIKTLRVVDGELQSVSIKGDFNE